MQTIRLCFLTAAVLMLAFVPLSLQPVSAQSRILYGKVYSAMTGQPISATITITKCGYAQSATTAQDGSWQLPYPYGWFGTITFSSTGYATETFQIGPNVQWYEAGGVLSLQPA
ncbi:MAG TPA: hypothetical protein VLV31_04345 [Candidatus Acidoferrales bacterium]|nr:hypothetical protein [Candidatus Acidoferrales bacterium]